MEAARVTALVSSAIAASIPLMQAGIGVLVAEKAGVLNLGVEGMMLMGAVVGYVVAVHSGLLWLGLLAGIGAGAAMALLFALLTLTLQSNQVASGLALTLFGTGLSAFIGKSYTTATLAGTIAPFAIPGLSMLPVIGEAVFTNNPVVYLTPLGVGLVAWFLYRTRMGLMLRAIGESPSIAAALGFPVLRIRYAATLFGGAAAGLGGAYQTIVYLHLWQEQVTSGAGWIALGLVVFSTWRPWRLVAGALMFGAVTTLQFFAQTVGLPVPSPLLAMLPYAATIVVLTLISRHPATLLRHAPASLGKSTDVH